MIPSVLLSLWMVVVPALLDGRCSACMWLGVKSTVVDSGSCTSTLVFVVGHYDEDGKYHPPPPQTTCVRRCSRGHLMVERF